MRLVVLILLFPLVSVIMCSSLGSVNTVDNTLLTFEQLSVEMPRNFPAPFPMSVFMPKQTEDLNTKPLQGQLSFSPIATTSDLVLTEKNKSYLFEKRTRPTDFTEQRKVLPKITIEFIQNGNDIIPTERGLQLSEHPHWDYIVGVGKRWQENQDGIFSRIAMPFSLVEKNQNCVHNGVISFLISPSGDTSQFYYQISSETCIYYKVDMWGKGQVNYQAKTLIKAKHTSEQYHQEVNQRLETKPLSTLKDGYPEIKLDKLALSDAIKPTDMTSFGVIFNDQHYVSNCNTRAGMYPFCAQLVLPSYSTAKSLFAALVLMKLEPQYPSIFEEKISDWVTQCNTTLWQDVTFGHLLNMTSGNYLSKGHSVDEGAEHSQIFFKAKSHEDKLNYSCLQFPKKSKAGEDFVYHTSDTYLLGSAVNHFLKAHQDQNADIFQDVLVKEVWQPLGLSAVAYNSRRSNDTSHQPFTGYGLFFTRDDVAKLANFLMSIPPPFEQDNTRNNSIVYKPQVSDRLSFTLIKQTANEDMLTQFDTIHYLNGFWKQNVSNLLACEKSTWLPYMQGYGGISIVLAKQNLQYYAFSDSHHYVWHDAIEELEKITPLCRQ